MWGSRDTRSEGYRIGGYEGKGGKSVGNRGIWEGQCVDCVLYRLLHSYLVLYLVHAWWYPISMYTVVVPKKAIGGVLQNQPLLH